MIDNLKLFFSCSSIFFGLPFMVSYGLSYADDKLNPCSCLEEHAMQSPEADLNRVHTQRASFHVPHSASPCKADSPDSEEWRWVQGDNVITYARSPFSIESNIPDSGNCEQDFPFGKAILSVEEEPDRIVARISDISTSPYGYHIISTSSSKVSDACVMMNYVLESFSFINDWSRADG